MPFPTPLYDPPSGWEGWTALDPANRDSNGDLDVTPGSYKIVGETVTFSGSNDGFRIRMTTAGTYNFVVWGCEFVGNQQNTNSNPKALTFRDDGGDTTVGMIHIEGCEAGGSGLAEAFDFDCPGMDVQMVNNRVDNLYVESAAHVDGTGGFSTSHPDGVQTYGGVTSLDIDGLTVNTPYQGLFFKADHGDHPNHDVSLSRVDIAFTLAGDGTDESRNAIRLDDTTGGDLLVDMTAGREVWIDAASGGGASISGKLQIDAANGSFRSVTTGTDGVGPYGTYPDRLYDLADGVTQARIYEGSPASEYVPSVDVGIGYTDPRVATDGNPPVVDPIADRTYTVDSGTHDIGGTVTDDETNTVALVSPPAWASLVDHADNTFTVTVDTAGQSPATTTLTVRATSPTDGTGDATFDVTMTAVPVDTGVWVVAADGGTLTPYRMTLTID